VEADVAVIVERLNVVLPTRKSGRSSTETSSALLQYGRQYPERELYNIDFDKVVSTEEELMDMLPRASPLSSETTADETGDVRTTDENSKPTSFGRSRWFKGWFGNGTETL
jgi:hypothetical protein